VQPAVTGNLRRLGCSVSGKPSRLRTERLRAISMTSSYIAESAGNRSPKVSVIIPAYNTALYTPGGGYGLGALDRQKQHQLHDRHASEARLRSPPTS